MYRAWQQYSVQWAKSQGGSYTAPGTGAAAGTTSTTGAATTGAATGTQGNAKSSATNMQTLYATIQSLDNTKLNAIAKILSQRVGPAATMNALKTPELPAPVTESMINELGWQDVKNTASNIGTQIKHGVQIAPQFARQVGQGYKKAAQAGMKAVKATPGAVATAAGATAGAIAGMPARAQTAYRTGKQFATGSQMTTAELQQAIFKLTQAQATKLYSFVQQLQTARKAGLKEGVSPDTLLPSYEQALKAFVQKNMLSGMQYSRLQNAQQIDDLIKKIVDPASDSAGAQKDLWNKLTLATAVAQHNPAQAGGQTPASTDATKEPGASTPTGTKPATGGGEDAETLRDAIGPVLKQMGQDKNAATIGSSIRKAFTNNADSIGSTGVPAVDAMLMTMGFKPA